MYTRKYKSKKKKKNKKNKEDKGTIILINNY